MTVSPRLQTHLILAWAVLVILSWLAVVIQQVEIRVIQREELSNQQSLLEAQRANDAFDEVTNTKLGSLCRNAFPGGGCE